MLNDWIKALLLSLVGLALVLGSRSGMAQGSSASDTTANKGICPPTGTENPIDFSKFEIPQEVLGSVTDIALIGDFRKLIQSTDRIEVWVQFDHKNPVHLRKRDAGETVRDDQVLYGRDPVYFRYLVPAIELNEQQRQAVLDLLLGPSVYQKATGLAKRSGVVVPGHQTVFRLASGDRDVFVSVPTKQCSLIWFSGELVSPFGGGVNPAAQSTWHRIIEEAVGGAGYK